MKGKWKENVYDLLVRKDKQVQYEYERYVMEHIEEHYENHTKHWKILWKLNWHYRVRKRKEPLLYREKLADEKQGCSSAKAPDVKAPAERNKLFAYVDGPESEAFSRPCAHHIVKKLLEYDVISFDIFDTLILRPFAAPSALFYLLEEQFGQRNFHKIRVDCEKRAREASQLNRGNREVTLMDIYAEIERATGIPAAEGAKAEFELEKKLCFANPYIRRVFGILKSYGKEIYAVSDMYLPKDMMTELLASCGLTGFLDVIVSCDYNCNKHENGALYEILKKQRKGRSATHVGDNWNADITMAKKHGLEAYFYKGVNAVGKDYRADGMTELVGSAYAGIINARLHCGLKQYPIYYEYGYVYGGIYVLGFCNYIASYCHANKIDKVLFLARDGDIYSRVFQQLYPGLSHKYVYWSRMANVIAMIEKDRYTFLERLIDGKLNNGISISVVSLFQSAGLSGLLVYLKEYRLNEKEYLTKENAKILRSLLTDHYHEVAAIYAEKEAELKSYYQDVIGDSQRVVIVDVGWTGSNVDGLSRKLTVDWKLCDYAVGILAASNVWNSNVTTPYDTKAGIQPYMFSRSHNRAEYDGFTRKNGHLGTVLFEIFTQSTTPSFVEIEHDGRFKFDTPEVENYEMIRQIHQGIFDFAQEYTKIFGGYRIMMQITGYDVYMPFRKVFRDLVYFKKYFHNMAFAVSLFSDTERQDMETLGEVIAGRGL